MTITADGIGASYGKCLRELRDERQQPETVGESELLFLTAIPPVSKAKLLQTSRIELHENAVFRTGEMSEKSEQVLTLLQEIAALKEAERSGTRAEAAAHRKRRKEIGEEIKELARHKKRE